MKIKISIIINAILIAVIKIYQTLKIRKTQKCLHYPSCSNYALLALTKYPTICALKKIIGRLKDCNPFSSRPYLDYP